MDIDASFQTDFLASPIMFGAARRNLAENLQMSGGLMRYHSAPSSEFARFLSDDSDLRPAHRAGNAPLGSAMNVMKEQQCSDECRSIGQQPQYMGVRGSNLTEDVCGPLSAIYELGLEEALDSFCSAQLPVLGSNQQVAQNTMDTGSHNPPLMSCSNFARLPQAKSNLIRHSSSPADILSRLVMEEISEKPISHFAGSYIQPGVENMPEGNSLLATAESLGTAASFLTSTCSYSSTSKAHDDFLVGGGSLASPSGQNRSGLLRQISSPAGLLSQLSLDGLSPTGEKVSVPSSSGYSSDEGTFDRGAGASLMANYAGSNWDEVGTGLAIENFAAFAQRKRGRGIEAKMLQGLMETDSLKCAAEHKTSPSNHFSVPASTSPGSTAGIDMSTMDSVLCRARAKRGCATHPRSIAERVRRTKISERMRKLQELVPNMDKQTNTADMLDEAVEYVKFLQRQVQELSKNQSKCNGTCRDKGNSPLKV